MQGNSAISPDIVHVDLSDRDLKTIPYSENDPQLYAELIHILASAGARTILIDIVFPTCREESCSNLVKEAALAGNVHFPVILSGATDSNKTNVQTPKLPETTYWPIDIDTVSNAIANGQVIIANFPALNKVASGLGHINSQPDADGVYRRISLLLNTKEGLIPSLALRTVCSYLGIKTEHIEFKPKRELTLQNAILPDGRAFDVHIPVGDKARNRIKFSGPWDKTFSHYLFFCLSWQQYFPGDTGL